MNETKNKNEKKRRRNETHKPTSECKYCKHECIESHRSIPIEKLELFRLVLRDKCIKANKCQKIAF